MKAGSAAMPSSTAMPKSPAPSTLNPKAPEFKPQPKSQLNPQAPAFTPKPLTVQEQRQKIEEYEDYYHVTDRPHPDLPRTHTGHAWMTPVESAILHGFKEENRPSKIECGTYAALQKGDQASRIEFPQEGLIWGTEDEVNLVVPPFPAGCIHKHTTAAELGPTPSAKDLNSTLEDSLEPNINLGSILIYNETTEKLYRVPARFNPTTRKPDLLLLHDPYKAKTFTTGTNADKHRWVQVPTPAAGPLPSPHTSPPSSPQTTPSLP